MKDFIFKPDTHEYFLDGLRLPSVTELLRPLYDFSAVSREVMRRAAEYGTAVHRTVELYLKHDLDEDNLDGALVAPLNAFKLFSSENPALISGILNIEEPGYHRQLLYAGTPDLEGDAVIDLKSRKCNPLTDALQLLFYDRMTGNGNRRHYVLELRQDGTYYLSELNARPGQRADNWSRCRYLIDFYKMQAEIQNWRG